MREKERMLDKKNEILKLEKMTIQQVNKNQIYRNELSKKKSLQEKGITLIALVVTIIILLILAGVTIKLVTGDNSIFKNAQKASKETKKAEIIEYLDLTLTDEKMTNLKESMEKIITNTQKRVSENGKEDLKAVAKEIEVKDVGKNTIDENEEEYYFYVVADEEVYKVGAHGTEYLGEKSSIEKEMEEGTINFKLSETEWTNKDVTVTANSYSLYTIETSINNETWEKKASRTLKENGTVFARLVDNDDKVVGEIVSTEVKNIDKEPPTITLEITGQDKENVKLKGTGLDEQSNIFYKWVPESKLIEEEWIDVEGGSFSENWEETEDRILCVKDEAGNVSWKKVSISYHSHDGSCGGHQVTYRMVCYNMGFGDGITIYYMRCPVCGATDEYVNHPVEGVNTCIDHKCTRMEYNCGKIGGFNGEISESGEDAL